MKRGFYGIGIYNGKTVENVGTLWRSAHNFGADFIFTIGFRSPKQASNTTKAEKHIPLYQYADWGDFINHLPEGCELVFIEQSDKSKSLITTNHPERAVYILGAEDSGVPEELMVGHQVVHIDTPMCLNVSVAGSIVMYDRQTKDCLGSLARSQQK